MDEIFLSGKNVDNQTKKLIVYLNLDKRQLNRDTVLKCRKIIANSMTETYDKYGERKPNNVSITEYIDKLNKKSLSDCIKILDAKKEIDMKIKTKNYQQQNLLKNTEQKSKYGTQAPNNNQYLRPNEIIKNQNHPEQIKTPSKEYQAFDSGGFAPFTSVENMPSGFITASGEYGMPPIDMQDNHQSNDGKKNYSDELTQKMENLRYSGGYGGNAHGQPTSQVPSMNDLKKFLPNADMTQFMAQQGIQNTQQNNNNNQQQMNPQLQQMFSQMTPQDMQIMLAQLLSQSQNQQQPNFNQQNQQQQPNFNQQQQQQPNFDYSYNTGGDNLGNELNAAYSGNDTKNNFGENSFDNVFQHNNITEPVKNLTEQNSDLTTSLERMKAEREQINNKLSTNQRPTNFDPMQSPSQINNNPNQQKQQNNGFFF
jgi:hypothetical protein